MKPLQKKKKVLKLRKAVKQVEYSPEEELQKEEGLGDYNIWYHKYIGQKKDPFETAVISKTRCNIRKHSGWTKGCDRSEPFFCLFFARGCCHKGSNCSYLHRLPTVKDEVRVPLTKDCFGREKFSQDREDLGGVGSFNRECKTLFVQGLKKVQTVDLNEVLIKNFKEWGQLSYVKLEMERCCARIKYKNRLNAEFAKEAMTYQTLGNSEILLITWAEEDSEMEKKRNIMENRRKLVEVLAKKQMEQQKNQNKGKNLQETTNVALGAYQEAFSKYYEKLLPQALLKEKQKLKNPDVVTETEKKELNYHNYLHGEYARNVILTEESKKRKREKEEEKKEGANYPLKKQKN